ncbi:MAG: Ig-like domain-containing protein [Thermogemmata sp.]
MSREGHQSGLRVRLQAEALEDRTTPAGNVTAFVSGGILFVQGDSASNQVWLSSLSEDTVAVTALGDTRVNGTWLPLTFSGVTLGWVITMGQGNDQVYISRTRGNIGVFLNTGAGNDHITLNRAQHAGPTVIRSGAGDDLISLGMGQYAGSVLVNAGGGNDRVFVSGVNFRNETQFDGGPGFDQLGLDQSRFGESPAIRNFEQVFTALMPTAVDDSVSVPDNGRITISVLANDLPIGGPFQLDSIRIVTQPQQGTVTVNSNGTITYVAHTTVNSDSDSFQYTVRNQLGGESNVATVHLRLPVALRPPTPTISTTASNPTNLASIPFRVTFNKNVTGFTAGDITVTNGTLSGFTTVNAQTYTFNVAPTADGPVTINIPAGAATDSGGRPSTAASFNITSDRTAPTVNLTTTASDPTNLAAIPFTATFSENVTGFTAGDITVTNGTVQNFSGSGSTYTFEVVPTSNGTVTVSIAANVAQDAAGNNNTASNTVTLTSDRSAPTVTLSTTATSPTNLAAIPFTATFSENVTGFTAGDITVTNGTVQNFSGSGSSYTFEVAPTADGPVTVSIAANVAQDAAGNNNAASNTVTLTSDRTKPTPTVSTTAGSSTNNNPIPFTVTFDENVTDFTAGDVLVTNGSIINFTQVNGSTYTFDVVPNTTGNVSVTVPVDVAEDAAGNKNNASNTVTVNFTGNVVTTTITTTESDPTNANPIPFTVTFSENVTGFTLSDIQVINGTAQNLTGGGASYTFEVVPGGDGPIVIDIPAGAATGSSGTPNSAGTFIITSDRTAPTVNINSTGINQISGTASDANTITQVELSIYNGMNYWDGTGFNSPTEVFVTASGTNNWSYTFMTPGTYTVHARATDAAGNVGDDTETVTVSTI